MEKIEKAIDVRFVSIENQVEGAAYLIRQMIPKSGYRNSAIELLNNAMFFVRKALEKVEIRPEGFR